MEFNGENLAKKGIIVVTVNYRLGALGFLAHPDLFKESPDAPANFGLLDQLAGLKWVKRNIASFGGDPDNITIAGQSAGGGSVLNHLTSESSIGLYQKAIILSGIISFPYIKDFVMTPRTVDDACSYGVKFFDKLGVKTVEEARKLDASYIREVYAKFRETESFFFTPMIDNVFQHDEPIVENNAIDHISDADSNKNPLSFEFFSEFSCSQSWFFNIGFYNLFCRCCGRVFHAKQLPLRMVATTAVLSMVATTIV